MMPALPGRYLGQLLPNDTNPGRELSHIFPRLWEEEAEACPKPKPLEYYHSLC